MSIADAFLHPIERIDVDADGLWYMAQAKIGAIAAQ